MFDALGLVIAVFCKFVIALSTETILSVCKSATINVLGNGFLIPLSTNQQYLLGDGKYFIIRLHN